MPPTQMDPPWSRSARPGLRLICPSACLSVQLLLQAVARHGEKCWWKVRLEVPGRTDGACRDR